MDMHTLKEEVYVLLYFISFGIYLFSTMDLVEYISNNIKKKVLKVIVIIIYWIIQIYITFIFSYHLLDGYLPIYFLLFIVMGYYLYYHFFKKKFLKIINIGYLIIKKLSKILKKLLVPFIYSKVFWNKIKLILKHYQMIIKKTFKKKNNIQKNEENNID